METHIHAKTCIQVFIAVLFIIATNWKQPKSPLIGKYPQNRILLSNKNNQTTTDICNNTDESPKSWVKEARHKRLQSICFHLHNHQQKTKPQHQKVDHWFQGTEEREETDCKRAWRNFLGQYKCALSYFGGHYTC